MDREKALRRADAVTLETDTFVISQALAQTQLRLSGVNFFTLEGRLGRTGRNLESFLNTFGRTVFPYRAVELTSGATIPRCEDGFLPVYNTDLALCFPGKRASGNDRSPYAGEIDNCLGQGYIIDELRIICPKLLLLMGDKSRRAFYKHFLGAPRRDTLAEHIASIKEAGELPSVKVSGLEVSVLPIQHASGANPSFYKMVRDQALIDIVERVLVVLSA
jgi:hypothetical protein